MHRAVLDQGLGVRREICTARQTKFGLILNLGFFIHGDATDAVAN